MFMALLTLCRALCSPLNHKDKGKLVLSLSTEETLTSIQQEEWVFMERLLSETCTADRYYKPKGKAG